MNINDRDCCVHPVSSMLTSLSLLGLMPATQLAWVQGVPYFCFWWPSPNHHWMQHILCQHGCIMDNGGGQDWAVKYIERVKYYMLVEQEGG